MLDYKKIKKFISATRLRKYEIVCKHDPSRTLKLYQTNLRLSQAYYSMLSLIEVIIRNALNEELKTYFNDTEWLRNQIAGFMNHSTLKKRLKDGHIKDGYLKTTVTKSIHDLGSFAHQGKIIADLSFGFWVAFFDAKHYRLLKGSPLKIFKNLPAGENRKSIHEKLKKVRDFRNRVYHNEPIIFKKDSKGNTVFDLMVANEIYEVIKDFYKWLDLDFEKWTRRINNIPLELKRAENMYNNYPNKRYYYIRIYQGMDHYYCKYLK